MWRPATFFRGGSILQSDLCVPSTRPFAFRELVDFSNTRPFVAILMCPFLFCVAEHLRMGKFQKVTHATEYQQRDSQLPFSEDYSAKQEKGWGLNDGNNLHPPNQVSVRPYWNMCENAGGHPVAA